MVVQTCRIDVLLTNPKHVGHNHHADSFYIAPALGGAMPGPTLPYDSRARGRDERYLSPRIASQMRRAQLVTPRHNARSAVGDGVIRQSEGEVAQNREGSRE